MTRSRTSAWVAATVVLVTACGGVQPPDSPDPSAAHQKAARVEWIASRQATELDPRVVNPAEELLDFAPDGILRWSEVPGSDAYEVWAYTDASLSEVVESSRTLQWRQYQFTRLVADRAYHAVVYYRTAGVWHAAPGVTLKTAASISKPRLTNAQDELDALAIGGQLQWTAVPGADSYELWLFADRDLSVVAETSGPVRYRLHRVWSLLPGRTYYAVVYANVGGEFRSGGALPVQVIEAADVPRLLNPPDELEAFSLERGPPLPGSALIPDPLRWSSVPDATAYEVWIFSDPNGSQFVANSGRIRGSTWAPWSLQVGRSYFVQVYALVSGQWRVGAPVKLQTIAASTTPRINHWSDLNNLRPYDTLYWRTAPGATAYELWIFGDAALTSVIQWGPGMQTDEAGSFRYSGLGPLCAGAAYYAQLFARVDGQWTVGSATPLQMAPGSSAATCVPPVPEVTLAVAPADIVDGDSVTLEWSSRYATSCRADGDWSGDKAQQGQEMIGPLDGPGQFTLTCTGPSGNRSIHRQVTIANYRPVAAFTASRTTGFTPVEVEFDASASRDPDGSIVGYRWDFGDGSTASGARVKHTFREFGTFDVELIVADDDGSAGTQVRAITAMPGLSVARYAVEEIPSLGGGYVEPFAINNLGQVVGYAYVDAGKVPRAFLYSDGATNELAALGGRRSEARDISDSGFIVGVTETAESARRAFVYRGGELRIIGTLGGAASEGNGVNEAGHVVGVSTVETGQERAFIDTYGLLLPLGTLGGDVSVATDVNDQAQVTGHSTLADGRIHAFLATTRSMTDLGTLGGRNSYGAAINDVGQVAGVSTPEGLYNHAFLYADGVMQDLDVLRAIASQAFAVNDAGVVVGQRENHAFVWDKVNGMRDLNALIDPGARLSLRTARAINEWGQIVVQGTREDGSTVAVVLTPETVSASVTIIAGYDQMARAGAALPAALTVRVTDSGGAPVWGAPVSWEVTAGGGSVEPDSGVTDSSGVASARWTLGPALGAQWATAAVAGLTPVSFRAIAFDEDPSLMPRYTAVRLGGPDGRHGNVRGINARGDVAGDSLVPLPDPPRLHAVVYTSAGTIVDLGTLGGTESSAYAINDAGDVVGWSLTADGRQRAFIHRNGVMQDLGTLGGPNSAATDINEHGDVVGWAETASGQRHAFVHRGGVMHDLGTFGGTESSANAINEAGQVVGWAHTPSGAPRAFLLENGTMRDLGTLGGPTSGAQDINNAGEVVGWATTVGGAQDAFVYRDGTMHALDCGSRTGQGGYGAYTHCVASAINDFGLVVGSATSGLVESPRDTHSAWQLWGGVVTGFQLVGEQVGVMQANDVNDNGRVAAMTNLGPFPAPGLPIPVDPLRLDPVETPAAAP